DEGDWNRLAQLWVQGHDLNWSELGKARRRLALPTYPFARERYWAMNPEVCASGTEGVSPPSLRRSMVDDFVDAVRRSNTEWVSPGSLEREQAGLAALEELGAAALLHAFHSVGLFRAAGERRSVD